MCFGLPRLLQTTFDLTTKKTQREQLPPMRLLEIAKTIQTHQNTILHVFGIHFLLVTLGVCFFRCSVATMPWGDDIRGEQEDSHSRYTLVDLADHKKCVHERFQQTCFKNGFLMPKREALRSPNNMLTFLSFNY